MNDTEIFKKEEQIQSHIKSSKWVVSKERTKEDMGMKRRDLMVTDNEENTFKIYLRQNQRKDKKHDFSCGLSLLLKDGSYFTLIRCNGSNHSHINALDGTKLGYCCHIHTAKQEYIEEDKKADGFAEKTDKYQTLEEAYEFLLKLSNTSDKYLDETFLGVDIWK